MVNFSWTFLAALFAVWAPSISALWPRPQQITTGTTPLRLSPGFPIQPSNINGAPQDLSDAITRTKQFLQKDNLQILAPDRGASNAGAISKASTLSKLTLSLDGGPVTSISQEAVKPLESRVEGYSLSIPANGGEAVLSANTTLGLFRAYPYRGFMLDTARNYFPVLDILRVLDAMSWVKLNTFHWHVVDSQSFPSVVPGFEGIPQKGAYSPAFTYSTSDHVACPLATPWLQFTNEPLAGQLRFASPDTTNFTAFLLTSASSLFSSQYFSTGGDELNINCYTQDAQTQQELATVKKAQQNKTLEQALDTFTQTTHGALREKGKTPAVWEEMAMVHNVTLGNDTLIMVWISSQNVQAVAQKGFKVVHAASDYFYLDCGSGLWFGNYPAGNSWCDPFKTWQKSYTFNPTANLTEAQSKLIMGGEHLLWTEQSGPSNLDPIVWPRAATSAELWWSGAGGNVDTALPTLQRRVNTIPLQPLWCALRPRVCDLDLTSLDK
ncbi:N-acetylhexosaminidase [Amanita muscaria]